MLLKGKLWDKPRGLKTLENGNLCHLYFQTSWFALLSSHYFTSSVFLSAWLNDPVLSLSVWQPPFTIHYIGVKQMLHICVNYINTFSPLKCYTFTHTIQPVVSLPLPEKKHVFTFLCRSRDDMRWSEACHMAPSVSPLPPHPLAPHHIRIHLFWWIPVSNGTLLCSGFLQDQY